MRRSLLMTIALAVSFSAASLADGYKSSVTAKVILKTAATSDGSRIQYPKTDRAEVTAMTVDIAPGGETGWHLHAVPVYAWVVTGSLDVELEGGRTNHYKEGDAIVEVVGTRHNGRNPGKVPARLLVFYTGAEGLPNVMKAPRGEVGPR